MPRNTVGLKRDAGPGRPKGSKDKFPRSFRKIAAEFCAKHQADLATAMQAAIKEPGERVRMMGVLASLERQQIDLNIPKVPLFTLPVGVMPSVNPSPDQE
jgi:hypothetical protein